MKATLKGKYKACSHLYHHHFDTSPEAQVIQQQPANASYFVERLPSLAGVCMLLYKKYLLCYNGEKLEAQKEREREREREGGESE